MPGNNELDLQDFNKLGHRQNRYGIFGDNGYQDAIEVSKRPTAQIIKVKEEPPVLSKEGVSSAMQKIQEFHQKKLEEHQRKLQSEYSFQPATQSPQIAGQERRILNEI